MCDGRLFLECFSGPRVRFSAARARGAALAEARGPTLETGESSRASGDARGRARFGTPPQTHARRETARRGPSRPRSCSAPSRPTRWRTSRAPPRASSTATGSAPTPPTRRFARRANPRSRGRSSRETKRARFPRTTDTTRRRPSSWTIVHHITTRTCEDSNYANRNERGSRAPPCGWRARWRTGAAPARRASRARCASLVFGLEICTRGTTPWCTARRRAAPATAATRKRGRSADAARRTGPEEA